MLKQLLLILALISLPACTLFAEVQEGAYDFKPINLSSEGRDRLEREKRESLEIVDTKVGNGPIAALGRRIETKVTIRYLDGTLAYEGNIFDYIGFVGDGFIHNAADQRRERGMLATFQRGIAIGLNGMAIGGQRRITIKNPLLVCNEPRTINPEATCPLTQDGLRVHQRPLVVEATLTESCIPQTVVVPSIASGGHAKKSAVVAPILPYGTPTIPSGDCTEPVHHKRAGTKPAFPLY